MGREKTKKKTGCLGKIIRFFIVLLVLFVAVFALAVIDAENDPTPEEKLDKYIAELALTNDCKTVIKDYLPDFANFDKIEQSALRAYDIVMKDGTVYYLSVMEDKEPACLMSSEKDYDSRTRYYDKFAK